MAVFIRFEQENLDGVVAEGATIWSAARRMGVRLEAECEGRGDCDTCLVRIRSGIELLSAPTELEAKRAGEGRFERAERMACQAVIEKEGSILVDTTPARDASRAHDSQKKTTAKSGWVRDRLSSVVRTEAASVYDSLAKVLDIPFVVGGKVIDVMAAQGRKKARGKASKSSSADAARNSKKESA